MPAPIADALRESQQTAVTKVAAAKSTLRFLTSAAMAGAFVGIAVVVLISVSAPLVAAGSPWSKLVQGLVFGLALTLVVFAGGELATGNVLYLVQGLMGRVLGGSDLVRVLALSFLGNAVGSLTLAAMVAGTGLLDAGTAPRALLQTVSTAKNVASGPELFWRAVLCNLLVCLGLWMAMRARDDGAKIAVLGWALLAFISSSYEHSVANMTVFTLGLLVGTGSWADLIANLIWTIPGNLIGGGVLVGLTYAWTTMPALSRPAPVPSGGQIFEGAEPQTDRLTA